MTTKLPIYPLINFFSLEAKQNMLTYAGFHSWHLNIPLLLMHSEIRSSRINKHMTSGSPVSHVVNSITSRNISSKNFSYQHFSFQ